MRVLLLLSKLFVLCYCVFAIVLSVGIPGNEKAQSC